METRELIRAAVNFSSERNFARAVRLSDKRLINRMTYRPSILLAALLLTSCAPHQAESAFPSDGVTDATAAIQQQLDARAATGGEVVLPPGQYLIAGSLDVPEGVCLRGSWDAPHHGKAWQKGTTLLLTGGRGQENGPAAIRLERNSALEGVTMLWPEQKWNDIQPYPWGVEGQGNHITVENVTLVNAYQGISTGTRDGSLHLFRNIYGCVLRRGILVDACSDIGRIENIHFNTHYWLGSGHPSSNAGAGKTPDGKSENGEKVVGFVRDNLEAFIFARSDWEYVVDTFVWDAVDAYHFVHSSHGECNGQFLGIGADYCKSCVQIDTIQDVGLQITNGEFTAFAGDPNTAIVTAPGARGAAQFVNCNFWGVKNHVAWMQGDTTVTLANCHVLGNYPGGAVLDERGKLIVQGCTFDQPGLAVVLKKDVKAAIIMGNLQTGGVQIQNEIGARAQIGLNEVDTSTGAAVSPGVTSAVATPTNVSAHP